MRSRLTLAALALLLAVGACDQDGPTSANTAPNAQQPGPTLSRGTSTLLTDVPVTGTTVYDENVALHPNNPPGSPGPAFTGTVTITQFAYDQATGTLRVSGVLKDASGAVVKEFTNVAATLDSRGAPTAPVCSILDLDIGAIHLDLLGLVVDLAPIHLDITAQSGPGNLLGNLLCALAGLLDRVPAAVSAILNIINQINQLLG